MKLRQHQTDIIHCLAIILMGMVVYANALTGDFQFDDKLNIVDNPLIRDPAQLWPPAGARWFGTFTFALNYQAGGLNPFGYHLVNIAIHILMALTVYAFVRMTFQTPFFQDRAIGTATTARLAAVCAILFVVHPIQTQAVTYIVQRYASLAALCYLLSLTCYIGARLRTQRGPASIALYLAAALSGLLAIMTKENAVTLPVMIVLYDLLFIAGPTPIRLFIRKQRRLAAATAAAAAALVAAITVTYDLSHLLASLRATNEISRHDYLITQFRVLITYLRLLLIPTGQTIDHHYPVFHSLAAPPVAASLTALLLLLATGLQLCRTSRTGDPRARLIAFGIFWFFITLSVESSLIPIADLMFEHRLYLPSVGAILAVSALSTVLLDRLRIAESRKRLTAAGVMVTVLAVLGSATHLRNRVWQNELSLWNDAIDKKPLNPRGYNMVGNYYRHTPRILDAIAYYRKALEVDPGYAEARSNLGSSYIQIGMLDEGISELMTTLRNNRFDAIDTGVLYYNIGKAYFAKGMIDQSVDYLRWALAYIPNEGAVHNQLAEAYRRQNNHAQAGEHLRKAHALELQK